MNTQKVVQLVTKKLDGRNKVALTENGRVCLTCKQPKSWDEFHTDIHGFNKKTSRCDDCRNKTGRKVYKDNPAVRRVGLKNRPDKLKKKYGVTWEHIVRVLDAQHGLCANRRCGKKISLDIVGSMAGRAVIDHDHKTGKFRALLCSHCNGSLGLIETKRNMLIGLIEYLTEHT